MGHTTRDMCACDITKTLCQKNLSRICELILNEKLVSSPFFHKAFLAQPRFTMHSFCYSLDNACVTSLSAFPSIGNNDDGAMHYMESIPPA